MAVVVRPVPGYSVVDLRGVALVMGASAPVSPSEDMYVAGGPSSSAAAQLPLIFLHWLSSTGGLCVSGSAGSRGGAGAVCLTVNAAFPADVSQRSVIICLCL